MSRTRQGEIDGVDLATSQVGFIYDVAPSLATYLITTDSAQLEPSDAAAVAMPLAHGRVSVMSSG